MKQSLTIKTGQHLAMTPALRQGIELLNLPSQEIEAKIQETLDSNIMLEEDETSIDLNPPTAGDEEKVIDQADRITEGDIGSLPDQTASLSSETDRIEVINDDISDASDNEVVFEDWLPGGSGEGRERQFDLSSAPHDFSSSRENEARNRSLRQHLFEQLELVDRSLEHKAISMVIIDALSEDGFLNVSLDEILAAFTREDDFKSLEPQQFEALTISDIEHVLKDIVQNFEPNGVGARSVKECLILQLSALEDSVPQKDKALICCEQFLDLFNKKDFSRLQLRLEISDDDFSVLVDLVRSLNPRPGASYVDHNAQYIVPDVYVLNINGAWHVESNTSLCPALRINAYYESLISRGQTDADNKTMQKHLTEAKFFLKSLRQRNDTVLSVARAIVARQIDFFEEGESAMKPMVLQDIADEVGRNPSTISRATSGKYMDTPRGTLELKYFFDSHVRTETGEMISSVAIRNYIQKIIADEKQTSPHSDQKISNLLAEQGFKVARRTVTKYRESLSIPSSSQRKQSLSL